MPVLPLVQLSGKSMKTPFPFAIRVTAAALLAGLAGCGGSSVTNVSVSGTITGLTAANLILTDGYATLPVAVNSTSFKFPTRLNEGYGYTVSIYNQPDQETCTVANGTGTIGTSDVTNVAITCAPNKLLGGTVSGLLGNGLILVNGRDNVTLNAGATTFSFPTRVAEGASYGVTVLQQPSSPSQTCTVANGVNVMGTTDVSNVQVTCQ
jgi:hypothetical protein